MIILDSKTMQEMDNHSIENLGIPSLVLMENAAKSWIEAARPWLNQDQKTTVFCGSGNNGGDGYTIARNLVNEGFVCDVVVVLPPKSKDCITNAELFSNFGETISWDNFQINTNFHQANMIWVDAVLGTGLDQELRAPLKERISFINDLQGCKLAVDIPSGINGSTGDTMGAAIYVDATITFQFSKIGHHLYPGKKATGKLEIKKISIKENHSEDHPYFLVDDLLALSKLPNRKVDAYKHNFGHVATWCGSEGTLGAAFLASFAALKSGSGLVTSALPEGKTESLLSRAPEIMTISQEKIDLTWIQKFDTLVLGCGLGREKSTWDQILPILKQTSLPLVLDADVFHGIDQWDQLDLSKAVLTPHAGEFAQLIKSNKPTSNQEKIEQALNFVKTHQTTLILKGAPTIIFDPTGKMYINSTGNAGMATAGTGDVLAGIVGSFLGQGLSPKDAAILGVWLHGKSGDLCKASYGEESMTAMSLIEKLGEAFRALHQTKKT